MESTTKPAWRATRFETCLPIIQWNSVQLFLILAFQRRWHIREINFVAAYLKARIELHLYMELANSIETKSRDGKAHVLKLKKLCRQQQTGRVWN